MTIRINQVPVDFTLEQEKTLADLAASLGAWADAQGWTAVSFLADGKAFPLDDPTPLAGVTALDMEAVPADQRDQAALTLAVQFFTGLSSQTDASWGHHQAEYASLKPLLGVLDPILPRLGPAFAVLDGPWDPATLPEAAAKVAGEARRLAEEWADPRGCLRASLRRLDAAVGPLKELGRLFQNGQDKDGFALILELLEVLDSIGRQATLYFRSHPWKDGAWKALHAELQPFLLDAESALSAGDYVLLTDLFEYELCPRLETLRDGFAGTDILDPVPDVL